MIDAPLFLDHGHGPVAQTGHELRKGVGSFRALGKGHFDLDSGFRVRILLGSLVGNEIGRADATQAKRFIRSGEIAVRSVEITVGILPAAGRTASRFGQLTFDDGKIADRKFHFDFEHDRIPPHFRFAALERDVIESLQSVR